ncbi:MAG: UDP-N-acetylmuramoyl-tripeptide--D-alanyl-D-alanine ligase [Frankiales bacterium]|nr:UDP-N-acetylmuramoyl-tripeptide--D-alanyl-D-alanine ligase [Frankiales bacterium]
MIALTLAEVAAAVGGRLGGGARGDETAVGISTDSRTTRAGDLFVAVVGEHHDAHDHAAQAVAAGAVGVLASRPLDVPCVVVDDTVAALGRLARAVLDRFPDLVVVGLTGSSGKTSTKDLLAQVLPAVGETLAPAGSFNTEVGLPVTVLGVGPTTRVLVVEMGARGVGHVRYLTTISPPAVGLVLNVGSAHVGEFGSVDAIAVAKGELVEALPAAERGGVAVLNADDPRVRAMASRTAARVVLFGESADADVRAESVVLDDAARPSYDLVHAGRRARVASALHGRHHVANGLAAAAVALVLGADLDEVAERLTAARPASRWRGDVTDTAAGVTVVNDAYNANPASMTAALETLAAMTHATPTRGPRRAVAVLGEMLELGPAAEAEHTEIGRTAVRLGVERLVAVGSSASVTAMRDAALAAGGSAVLVEDVGAAADLLRTELRAGDVVLVKASRSVGLERVAEALLAAPVAAQGTGEPA